MYNWEYIDECYIYDGSFNGLLTIVFDCYINNQIPIKISTNELYENNILDKIKNIETDEDKSKRIYNGIIKNISYSALYISYNAFLSGKKEKEIIILKFLLNGFKIGSNIITMFSIDYVTDTLMLKRNTLFEAHRLKGLVKFRCIGNNLYYAPMHPDNNVIEHVGKHFIDRLPAQNFILHDKNRNIALIYNTKEYSIFDIPENFKISEFSEEEKMYQKLWKTFFKTISIKERTNPKLQMNYMPKKYWKDLVEKES